MTGKEERIVYLTDGFVPESQAHISIADAGIVMGATVTEMTRTFRRKPYRLRDHVERLYRSFKYARLGQLEIGREEMVALTEKLIEHNAPLESDGVELGVVHFITPGLFRNYLGGAAGVGKMTPTVCIHSFPLRLNLFRRGLAEGFHAVTPPTRHIPPQCLDPKLKYRSRLHWWIADREAKAVDPAAVTLLLDLEGNITETSGANFMLVRDGVIYSPTTRNILLGVSRKAALEIAAGLGITVVEKDLQLYDAITADEAFVTTTPFCIGAVTRINGLPVGDGTPGPVFEKLLAAWSEEVGVDIRKQVLEFPEEQGEID